MSLSCFSSPFWWLESAKTLGWFFAITRRGCSFSKHRVQYSWGGTWLKQLIHTRPVLNHIESPWPIDWPILKLMTTIDNPSHRPLDPQPPDTTRASAPLCFLGSPTRTSNPTACGWWSWCASFGPCASSRPWPSSGSCACWRLGWADDFGWFRMISRFWGDDHQPNSANSQGVQKIFLGSGDSQGVWKLVSILEWHGSRRSRWTQQVGTCVASIGALFWSMVLLLVLKLGFALIICRLVEEVSTMQWRWRWWWKNLNEYTRCMYLCLYVFIYRHVDSLYTYIYIYIERDMYKDIDRKI